MSYVGNANSAQRFAFGTHDDVACVILLQREHEDMGRPVWMEDKEPMLSLLQAIYCNNRVPHIPWQ